MRASFIVPTWDEAGSIGPVLRTFRAAAERANREIFPHDPVDWEVVVVDGRSTDGTVAAAEREGARVLLEPRPGYGRAYRTAFEHTGGEFIATADGDGTYPVEEIPALLRKLCDEQLDFLTGNRMAQLTRKAMTTEHRVGNRVLNLFLRIAYHRFLRTSSGKPLADSQSGLWVFRRSVLDRIQLTQDGMAFSEELKLELLIRGFRLEEVPIRYAERWGAPKLSSWKDGGKNLLFLLTKRLEVQREVRRTERLRLSNRTKVASR